jgi:hypothetical protein
MHRTEAIAWVVSVCAGCLRLSQAKTLSILVAAAMRVERASLANIGRAAAGAAAKHQVKRCWRFVANERVAPACAMGGVVAALVRKRRKKPLLVALDWVDVRGFQTLMAAAVLKGRSVPLCWASCTGHTYDGHRSRNAFEESLLLLVLRSMIPEGVKVILLADRGFGRAELARFCQRYRLSYVIRVKSDVWVKCAGYEGNLFDYPVKPGACKLLRNAEYRKSDPVAQHVVVRWVRGLPKERDECWFLMTDLTAGPARVSRLYRRRMTIEELFRDHKSKRNGWSLRDTRVSTPERLDRLLLVLALAYILLAGLGLHCRRRYRPGTWCSNNRDDTLSDFAIARAMLDHVHIRADTAFRLLLAATRDAAKGNWG